MIFWIKDHGKLFKLKVPNNVKIVYQANKGLSLFANRPFKKGERIISLKGKLNKSSKAAPEAVQFDENYFIDTRDYVPEDFINHSCNPNSFIDFNKKYFVAIKNIKKNEEITYNYLTTDYNMSKYKTNFKCSCGSRNCFKQIRGFKYLSKKEKMKLKPFLSPFLLKKLKKC